MYKMKPDSVVTWSHVFTGVKLWVADVLHTGCSVPRLWELLVVKYTVHSWIKVKT